MAMSPGELHFGVYNFVSQLIRFAGAPSHVSDFDCGNKTLTVKLLKQDYRYHKLRKTFSKFYCPHRLIVFSVLHFEWSVF